MNPVGGVMIRHRRDTAAFVAKGQAQIAADHIQVSSPRSLCGIRALCAERSVQDIEATSSSISRPDS